MTLVECGRCGRWLVIEKDIDVPCWTCGQPLRRVPASPEAPQ